MQHDRKNGRRPGGQQAGKQQVRPDERTHFMPRRQPGNQRDRRGADQEQSEPPKWVVNRVPEQIGRTTPDSTEMTSSSGAAAAQSTLA